MIVLITFFSYFDVDTNKQERMVTLRHFLCDPQLLTLRHYIRFEQVVHRIYSTELQLNEENASDAEAAWLDLNLYIHNCTISTKIYGKRNDFDSFNSLVRDGDVPWRPSYGVYISQLIRSARASSHLVTSVVKFFNAKLHTQDYWYHKLCIEFFKLYCRHNELIEIFYASLKKRLQEGFF